jgi:hypothetical protein
MHGRFTDIQRVDFPDASMFHGKLGDQEVSIKLTVVGQRREWASMCIGSSVALPWASDLELAREVLSSIGGEIRCDPGDESLDPFRWLAISSSGETEISWGFDDD